ncbi:MAG: hypothetical protein ACI934_001871, partial [Pseudohongiellaceae bacterium]
RKKKILPQKWQRNCSEKTRKLHSTKAAILNNGNQ